MAGCGLRSPDDRLVYLYYVQQVRCVYWRDAAVRKGVDSVVVTWHQVGEIIMQEFHRRRAGGDT